MGTFQWLIMQALKKNAAVNYFSVEVVLTFKLASYAKCYIFSSAALI